MKAKKIILPLLLCFSVLLTSMQAVFADKADTESRQENSALSLLAAVSGVSEALPTWNTTNPTWEPINSDLNNESRFAVLKKILENTDIGDRYVRLNADISIEGDYLSKYKISVKGKNVLDLNGHKLSIKLGEGEGYSGRQIAITVNSGATLMIIDSKGGGKIFGDTWICAPTDLSYERASTDLIYNNGTLIIHMPNGEIETGRSKQQWVTAAAEDGEYPDIAYARYSGYIRGQANGSAIIGTKNSTTVLVSGRVIGRGFYKFGTEPWSKDTPSEKCAAIETKGKFIMYGGEVFGLGGADALRAYGGKDSTIVYSGNFRVKSLDKMTIAAYKAYTERPNFTKECGYGFPVSGERNYAPGSELITDSHETVVRPISDTSATSDTVQLSHQYGTSIIDLEKQSTWVVYAYYTPYFSQPARQYLGYSKNPTGYDYNVPTFWKATAKFTVLDYRGNEIGYYNEPSWLQDGDDKTTFRCDVLACKDKKGNPIAWEERLTYTLRCTVTESWDGDPAQTRVAYQDLNFRFWDSETQQTAKNLTFDFIPTPVSAGEPTSYIIALNSSCVNDVKNSRISQMEVRYNYYDPIKDNKGVITGFKKKSGGTLAYEESLLDNDGTNYFPKRDVVLRPKAAGPLEVSIDLYTASGVRVETKNYNIFAMPALTARFVASEEYAVPSDGYTMTPQFSTWKLYMNSGVKDFVSMTDHTVSLSAVKWQYYDRETGKFVNISSTDGRFVLEDDGNVMATNRAGEYRAGIEFGDSVWYSPRTIYMNGRNFDETYDPYISGPLIAEYGDKTKLTVKLNDDANWSGVTEYILICRGYPTGARTGNTSVSNKTGVFDIEESFFRPMNEDTFVPGNYFFEAKVRHANGVATSRRFTLTYEKTNSDYTFLVNNARTEYFDTTGESRYVLPTDGDGTFKFDYCLYPANASKNQYSETKYNYRFKNLTPDIIRLSEDNTASVLSPGDAKLQLEITEKSSGSLIKSVLLTVTVPIVGFEVEQPNYNLYLGKKWEDVRADVKSVWGPGGQKVTANANQYLTVSPKSLQGVDLYDTVSYNNKADIDWTARANTGYRFAMRIIGSGYTNDKKSYTMCADVYSIRTNNFTDTVKTAIEHRIYEANSSGDFYYRVEGEPDGEDTHDPTNAKIYLSSKNAHVKDPNVQYIDVVSITTSTPAVGDLRYEGTDPDQYYNEFMNVEIGTLSGVLNTDGNPIIAAQTHVSKLDAPTGSGKPYDNAKGEPMGDYYKITNIVNGVAYKPAQRYETGIHKNWLRLETYGTDSSGTKYLFAPEMKLFVNGHLIEYADVSYDKYMLASSRLDVFYYFDVGKVTQHTSATVDMTDITPIAGEKPKDIADVSVENTNDIEVTKLLWFVDENGNGKYDFGEEADSENGNLSANGKFLPNKKYSVDIEVGLADGAAGRIAYPFSLNVKYDDLLGTVQQTERQTVNSLEPNGVFTFPVTYIASVDETVDEPSDGSYNKYFAPINIKDEETPLKGYSLSSYSFRNPDGTSITEEFELTPGKQYWYVVSFTHAYNESWFSPLLTVVSIDGVPLVRGTSDTHSWYEIYSNITTIHYLYTVPGGVSTSDVTVNAIGIDASKYSASGQTVTVTHDKACKIGYLDGETYKAVAATKISDGKYSFTVPDGVKEVILVVKGDANGDGNVNSADSMLVNRITLPASHPAHSAATSAAVFASDVNGDGNVNSADAMLLNRSLLPSSHPAYKTIEN